MGLLSILRAKNKEDKQTQQKNPASQQKQMKKGLSPTGAVFLVLGVIGLAVFGYLLFQNGGFQSQQGVSAIASGVGLILSGITLVVAFYTK